MNFNILSIYYRSQKSKAKEFIDNEALEVTSVPETSDDESDGQIELLEPAKKAVKRQPKQTPSTSSGKSYKKKKVDAVKYDILMESPKTQQIKGKVENLCKMGRLYFIKF